MITTNYTIDNLTTISVSVKTQKYYEGMELGLPHRKSYLNSNSGREEVRAELPIAQVNAILAVWGEIPSIDEQTD